MQYLVDLGPLYGGDCLVRRYMPTTRWIPFPTFASGRGGTHVTELVVTIMARDGRAMLVNVHEQYIFTLA